MDGKRLAICMGCLIFFGVQALKKEDAEKAAIQKKADAKLARENAKSTVANFQPFSKVPANSGLGLVWQVALPQLVAVMCKVRPLRNSFLPHL